MKLVIPLTIESGLSQSGSYILTLLEPQQGRRVPIVIGAHEAKCILLAKQNRKARRPTTHELMLAMMNGYGLSVSKVTIDSVLDGVFYATIHTTDGFSNNSFDSRTTDAIAIALLTDAPIMMNDAVIEEVGMVSGLSENSATSLQPSIESLEEELRRCEENEEYERAAEIQNKIESLKRML